jgi:hypothetical protein
MVGFKLMNLDANYNYVLVEMGVDLFTLANELKLFSFLVLMYLKVSQGEPKPQGPRQPFAYILDSLNKFSNILTNELPDAFPPCKKVDHKIKMVPKMALPSKAPYKLN